MGALKLIFCLAVILIPGLNSHKAHQESLIRLQPDLKEDLNPFAFRDIKENAEDFHVPHYQAIVQDLTSVNGGGAVSSYLSLFGKDMFPVMIDGGSVIIAGGLYGKGRIFVAGHEGYVQSPDPGLRQLTQNAIQWLAQTNTLEGIKMAVSNGASVGNVPATNWVSPQNLENSEYQVYYSYIYDDFNDSNIEKILKFVENGGGLIIAGQIWGWYYNNGGEFNALSMPGNKLLKNFGVIVGTEAGVPSTFASNLHWGLYYALKDIECEEGVDIILTPEGSAAIGRAAGITLNLNTNKDPLFQEIIQMGLKAFDCLPSVTDRAFVSRMVASMLPLVLLQNPSSIMKARDHEKFPGSVPDDAERVTDILTFNGTYIGYPLGFGFSNAGSSLMLSTGLYAPAGSVIKVLLDQDFLDTVPNPSRLEVQIGCHVDVLYGKPEAPRSPQIVTSSGIYGSETIAANPWGGLVYIKIPRDVQYSFFNVTISNVVRAPYFKLGTHDAQDWKATIRNYPAPWGELEVPDQIIFTVPSTALRNYEDEEELLVMYEEIMAQYNFLQGFEGNYRFRAERIVLDAEISAGWMHSGYPVMGYMDYSPNLIDPNSAKSGGVWGEFHELGHNAQWSQYTTGATGESGCNVYAHYVNKKLFNETSRFVQSRTDAFLAGFLLDGSTGYGGQVAVLSYTLLLDRYGFEHWRNMNRFYMQYPDLVEGEAYDVFTRVMANVTKMNVCPFYSFFGFTLSEKTLATCNEQPPMPDLIIDRYDSVMAELPAPQGECPAGWIQHGASCFLINNENSVNWDLAEKTCQSINPESHLASCFSEEEAFFLTRHIKTNQIQGSYHVGIDENNEENVAKFLDQSPLPSLLPWSEFRPAKDGNRCTIMEGGWLKDVNCNSKAGVICKTGPTSCAPKVQCPEGWTRLMDSCYWMFYGGTNFDAAVQDCQSKGAHVLEINSQEESDFFKNWVNDARWNGQYYWRNYWLGMDDMPSGKWMSGAPLSFSEFCDEMDLSAREGVLASLANSYCWGGLKKTQDEAYICEKPISSL